MLVNGKTPAGQGGANGETPEAGRSRPGRRSAADRTQAVLELLSGKATVEQLSRRFGVQPRPWRAGETWEWQTANTVQMLREETAAAGISKIQRTPK